MSDLQANLHLEIAHILFIDVVGYSKLLINEQSEAIRTLNQIVLQTAQVRTAEAAGQLIRLATGDGMALVFRNHPEAPAECALEIGKALRAHPQVQVRMGVHSGPVNEITDVNERVNIAGAGMNIAQRVMDCGDASHILLSKRVADDLAQFREWQPFLHDLGEVEVKHGVRLPIVNLYREDVGNPAVPEKLRQRIRGTRRRRFALATGLAFLLALVFGASLRWTAHRLDSPGSSSIVAKSIAVLPFENLSTNQENAFFADGVQDEILTDLAKVADLKVISRSSVLQYKNAAARNLRQIAQELGVAHILEGSVQRSGDQIRVNAQLIDARTDAHLWAHVYDRKVADLFAIQSEIARTITAQLQAKLSPGEGAAIDRPPTDSLPANALYLRARQVQLDPSPEADTGANLKKAEQLLKEAIALDPNFVLAHCELANVYGNLYWNEIEQTPECRARGDAEIEIATRLAPDMGEVHLARALHFYHGYRQYRWARAEFDLALRALPNEPRVYESLAWLDRREGHWDAAVKNFRRVFELDPASMDARFELADLYVSLGWFADVRRLLSPVPATGVWGENKKDFLADVDFLEKGDMSTRMSITPAKRPDGSVPFWNLKSTVYARDADRAAKVLADMKPEMFSAAQSYLYWKGAIAQVRGDRPAMLRAYGEARAAAAKGLEAAVDDPELFGALGLYDAILGNKEEAVKEGWRATELLPLEQDSVRGMELRVNLVYIYGWIGELDKAFEELERLMKIPRGPRYGHLRYYPQYDPLRNDARFQKILASVAPSKTR